MAIWRLNSDGSFDTSFGGSGYVVSGTSERLGPYGATAYHNEGDFCSLQIDSSGRYVVVGPYQNTLGGLEDGIWRFNSDGTVDATFGGGAGYVLTGTSGAAGALGAAENDGFDSLQFDSSNRLVIVGYSTNLAGGKELTIWRYNSDGSVDITFGGGNGFIVSGAMGAAGGTAALESDVASSLQIDSSGRYVIAGLSENSTGGTEAAIWRYNSNGSADTTLSGGTGFVLTGVASAAGGVGAGEYDGTYTLQIDSQGRYVVAGSSANSEGGTELAIWRLLSTGAVDR